MAKLTESQQLFIVRALACYDSPSQVVDAVKQEFGIDLIRQHVAIYDPTKPAGHKLSKKLRAIFEATRKAFLEDVSTIPLANQATRLRALSRLHAKAESQGNTAVAAQLLEQIAKEVGGAFTNRRELTGKGGAPIATQNASTILTSVDPVEAAKMYQDFIAGG